jgi:CTP synthase (UTP-ammonia lyase)
MTDKYTILSKVILQSFAHSQKHARKTTSAGKRKNIVKCKDEDKIRTIVEHYNNHLFQEFHLELLTGKITNKEMRQWKAIWRGLNGKDSFSEKARRCRITLECMYRDALKANNRLGKKKTKQATSVDSEVEVKMVDNLDSIIKDCNCYLLKNVHVSLVIKEKIKRGRNKSRW